MTNSETVTFKSAVAEHGFKENHIIDWDGSDILAKDNIKNFRWKAKRHRYSE